jgi:peptide/nickel transport system substrate-binding protein
MDQKTGCIAESWEIPELGTCIFHIRDDVYWQDKPPANGRQLTVDDIEFTINRAMSGGYFKYAYPGLAATIEVTVDSDDWTVTCTVPESEWVNFITLVSDYMSITCPEAIDLWED